MNVAFWSTAQGKCGTTYNMMAVAVTVSLVYPLKPVMIHTGGDSFVWEKNYTGKNSFQGRGGFYNKPFYPVSVLGEDFSYYGAVGLDDIIESSRLKNVSENMIYENMLKLRTISGFYIPGFRRIGRGIRDDEAALKMPEIMKIINKMSDICFIDTKNGNDRVSSGILDAADIVVINVCQNGFSTEEYENIPAGIKNKSVCVIGRFDGSSKNGMENIRRKLKIEKDSMGAIPYSINYGDAVDLGNMQVFFEKTIQSGKSGKDVVFMDSVRKTADMILKKAGYNV